MDMLLKFGIEADSSTFELPRYVTLGFETGVFKTGDFKTGKFKTGFAENLGHTTNSSIFSLGRLPLLWRHLVWYSSKS